MLWKSIMFPKNFLRRSASTGVRQYSYAVSQQDVDRALQKMRLAQERFMELRQEDVDHIVKHVSRAMKQHAYGLAKAAVEESGIGCVEDKTLKNLYATEHTVARYQHMRTVGAVSHDEVTGITKIAEPVGPICAILPCTNPVATTIIKSLYSIKTRNCIFMLPHPRSAMCSIQAAGLIQRYAADAGAPDDIIMSAMPSKEISQYAMQHKDIRFLLATGGSDMVRACYSVGKPAIGVGPGNTPVLVDGTFDIQEVVNSVLIGKTFDWGVPCITEQSIILLDAHYDAAKELFRQRGVHFLSPQRQEKLGKFFFQNGRVNPDIVGKSPQRIGELACLDVPADAICIGVEATSVSRDEPFAHEKMSPILTFYRASTFKEGVEMARTLALGGGPGHSSCIYTTDDAHLSYFQRKMPTYHVNVNMPALGGIGIRYNTNMAPTMTVGCGVLGGSISSVNVGPAELLQWKYVAHKVSPLPRPPQSPIICKDTLPDFIDEMRSEDRVRRAFVVADKHGEADAVAGALKKQGYHVTVFAGTEPTMECVQKGVRLMKEEMPSVLFAVGGATAMDVAKMIRLRHDNPDHPLEDIAQPFIEPTLRKKIFPTGNCVTLLVAVPSTSSAGSEMTPFTQTIVSGMDSCNIWLDAARPDVVIAPQRTNDPAAGLMLTGFQALMQAFESSVSAMATDQTRALAKDAIRTLFCHIEKCRECPDSRQHVLQAIAQVGISAGNAGLGLATSMAIAVRSRHDADMAGLIGLFLPQVMRFNMSEKPTRVAAFPSYPYLKARDHYLEIADHIGLTGTADAKIEQLLCAVVGMKSSVCPSSAGIEFLHGYTDDMMHDLALSAFAEPLGGTNPRAALIDEIKDLYLQSRQQGV